MKKTSFLRQCFYSIQFYFKGQRRRHRALPGAFSLAGFILSILTSAVSWAGQISLAWDANTQPEVAGYKVYYGTVSGQYTNSVDVGMKTTAIITGLTDGASYYFAVTDYNADRSVESAKSNEVLGKVPAAPLLDTTAPVISAGSPSGTLPAGTTSTTMKVSTTENASCKFSYSAGIAYGSMLYNFTTTGGLLHSTTLPGLKDGSSYSIFVRCQDIAGNPDLTDYSINFAVASVVVQPTPTPTPTPAPTPTPTPISGGQTLLTSQMPQLLHLSDGASAHYELGMRFMATTNGTINAIRFYKDSSETGTHTGKIYSASGAQLASVVFSGESASGWQQAALSAPLAISANTEYTVSVNTGNTFYVTTNSGMATQIVNGNLKSMVGGNGVYGPIGAKPTTSWQNSNYFRDIVFVAGTTAPTPTPTPAPASTPTPTPTPTPPPTTPTRDTLAPVVSISAPLAGASVAVNTIVAITATATDNMGVSRVAFYVNGSLKCSDSTAPYSCNWRVPRRRGRTHNIQVRAYDAAGNVGTKAISVISK